MIIEIDKDLQDLFPRYLEARRRDIKTMRDLVDVPDLAALASMGHKISGNAGAYGLADYGKLAKSLEERAKAAEVQACVRIIDAMDLYLKDIVATYV